ncbi:MAG: DNA polymerase IV [Actinobacteria bacterium]|nr:MAG: DNA polymerase IV [Actinomycetota bacterium]
MDAFFAAIEQLKRPELRGKPVIVGGDPDGRGVVAACSYEARAYGIHSAMPMTQAKRRCPHAVCLPGDMKTYASYSKRVKAILDRYTPLVEPVSVDEAFLDVTGCERLFGEPEEIARKIKADVLAETGLTCSVGIAPNRFLAKLASDLEKPDGLVELTLEDAKGRLRELPVSRIWGVGKVGREKLETMGIFRIGQLQDAPLDLLEKTFGNQTESLRAMAFGRGSEIVEPPGRAKSVSNETTFEEDTADEKLMRDVLRWLAERVARRMRRGRYRGRTITLKLRFSDFKTITRSATVSHYTDSGPEIGRTVTELFERVELGGRKVRLLGVGVGNLETAYSQLTLYDDGDKQQKLDETMDSIRDRFGEDAVTRGVKVTWRDTYLE